MPSTSSGSYDRRSVGSRHTRSTVHPRQINRAERPVHAPATTSSNRCRSLSVASDRAGKQHQRQHGTPRRDTRTPGDTGQHRPRGRCHPGGGRTHPHLALSREVHPGELTSAGMHRQRDVRESRQIQRVELLSAKLAEEGGRVVYVEDQRVCATAQAAPRRSCRRRCSRWSPRCRSDTTTSPCPDRRTRWSRWNSQ